MPANLALVAGRFGEEIGSPKIEVGSEKILDVVKNLRISADVVKKPAAFVPFPDFLFILTVPQEGIEFLIALI